MSESKSIVIPLLAGLVIGVIIGFGAEYAFTTIPMNSLKNEVSILNSEVASLKSDKDLLQDQVSTLNSQVNSLTSDKESLQEQVRTLSLNVSELKLMASLGKSKTLEKDRRFEVITYYNLLYDVDYAGYLEVEFSVVGEIYFTVEGSGISYKYPFIATPYTIPIEVPEFPMYDGKSSGSFTIPVLPGSIEIRIVNPHDGVPTAYVTATVTYVY